MSAPDLKFGTSGLRGLAADLDGAPAVVFSRAFADVMIEAGYLAQGGMVLIGRDLRSTSPSIAQHCAAGLTLAGADAVDCGALPTPALAARAMALRAPAIMVTGSHIPDDRNGLKFYRPDGEIDKQDEAAIVRAAEGAAAGLSAERVPARQRDETALSAYAERAREMLPQGALAGMRIGVYQHSTVVRETLVDVLGALGADVVPFGRSETFVPVDTEAVRPEDGVVCRAMAAEHDLHVTVSADGDADRPLIADENGAFLRGDLVGAVTAQALGADCIVTPITSNSGIERSGRFARVVRTRIGSPHVIAGMNEASGSSVVVGFEANGGVLLGTDAVIAGRSLAALPTRDAMLPILAVLWTSKSAGRPLSAFASEFGFAEARADRLQNVSAAASGRFLSALRDDGEFRHRFVEGLLGGATIDLTDGVRLQAADGSVLHFRASGNAPELRCYIEAGSPEKADELLRQALARAGAVVG